jgi:hypothetical protein
MPLQTTAIPVTTSAMAQRSLLDLIGVITPSTVFVMKPGRAADAPTLRAQPGVRTDRVSVSKQKKKFIQTWASPASGLHTSFKVSASESNSSNAATASSISRQMQLSTDTWAS